MFALDTGPASMALSRLASALPKPAAIVVISPHWETQIPTVSSAVMFDTIHDFSGFDPKLYDLRYAAKGSESHAIEVVTAVRNAGFSIAVSPSRGLDHGAWVPLRHLYPKADIPIVPLSIQHHGGPQHAYAVGRALAPLRERGYLIIGSGNITHNLRDWHLAMTRSNVDTSYAQHFADWVHEQVTHRSVEALLDYRRTQAAGLRAHPRDEHLLPLFTTLGAAGVAANGGAFYRGISEHVLAMDGYVFH